MRKKIKKCFIKPLFALCSLTAAVLFAGVLYLQSYLPANYYVYEGSSLSVQGPVPLSCEKSALAAPVENTLGAQSYTVNLKAFGVIPVKSAAVQVINNRKVKVLGTGFGIKIYTAGVMVVKLDTVDTERGQVDVAGRAGVYAEAVGGIDLDVCAAADRQLAAGHGNLHSLLVAAHILNPRVVGFDVLEISPECVCVIVYFFASRDG